MISVNELRVGNILWRNMVVVTIDERSIFDIWDNSIEYTPIPITEVWLDAFRINKSKIYFSENLRLKINCYDECDVCIEQYHEGAQRLKHITHIHQLQNLYFALTGTELTLTK